jgi:hypothetical protein
VNSISHRISVAHAARRAKISRRPLVSRARDAIDAARRPTLTAAPRAD